MWNAVFLDYEFGRFLIKLSIQRGHIKLAMPNSRSEAQQVESFSNCVNRSRINRDTLLYCLFAERVYVDPPESSWLLYDYGDIDLYSHGQAEFETSIEEIVLNPERNIIESESSDFSDMIGKADSMRNIKAMSMMQPAQEFANRLGMIEPLIWKNFKKSHVYISRSELRYALDLVVSNPEILNARLGEKEDFRNEVVRTVNYLSPKAKLNSDDIEGIVNFVRVATIKADVAACHIAEAERLNALYPVKDLTFGRSRTISRSKVFSAKRHDEIVASVRMFLDEIKWVPVLDSIDDVFRLRQHRSFVEFRNILASWTEAILSGNHSEEARWRKEIGKSNIALRRITACSAAGRFFTYLSIPLSVLDLLVAPVFGLPTTVAGFSLQGYSDWLQKKNGWIMIGK